jgi:hypothetical protein
VVGTVYPVQHPSVFHQLLDEILAAHNVIIHYIRCSVKGQFENVSAFAGYYLTPGKAGGLNCEPLQAVCFGTGSSIVIF